MITWAKETITKNELEMLVAKENKTNCGLDLSSLETLPEGVSLTAGGGLDLSSLETLPEGVVHKLSDGMYVPGEYLYADGILTHIKRSKMIGEYTYYIGKISGRNVIFDGKNYAHCKSVSDGINELAFKTASNRGAEQYRGFDMDKPMTVTEAMTMYRVITGACQQGTQRFIDSLGELKEAYTVREIIGMTSGQYGGDAFRKFFEE